MTGSTSGTCEIAMPHRSMKPGLRKSSAASQDSPLARLKDFFFGRRAEMRRLPPLKNAHYIAVHMAAATHRESLR